jgi:hypothetical protein
MKNITPNTATNNGGLMGKDLIHLEIPRVSENPSNPFFKRKTTFKDKAVF